MLFLANVYNGAEVKGVLVRRLREEIQFGRISIDRWEIYILIKVKVWSHDAQNHIVHPIDRERAVVAGHTKLAYAQEALPYTTHTEVVKLAPQKEGVGAVKPMPPGIFMS